MFGSRNAIVPVVMFHSVGLENSSWEKAHLSESVDSFVRKMEGLKKRGTEFWHLGQLHDYMNGRVFQSRPTVVLTFDDGYLDNWIYVFPILKKLGIKATVFVNPEFADPCEVLRSNLEDVWSGRVQEKELLREGFLSWREMREMEADGLVDIQSHALTHTWYFTDSQLVDFHHPRDSYGWLAWNAVPERKFAYMREEQEKLVPYGYPIFKYDKALVAKKYYPDEEFVRGIVEFCGSYGSQFWERPDWKSILDKWVADDRARRTWKDSWESEDEYRKRVSHELTQSKIVLEGQLNKRVEFICWPGGAYNQTVLALARDAGYKAWTLSSRDQSGFRNLPGADSKQIKRVGSFSRYRSRGGRDWGAADVSYFFKGLEAHKGSWMHRWLGRFECTAAAVRSAIGGKR